MENQEIILFLSSLDDTIGNISKELTIAQEFKKGLIPRKYNQKRGIELADVGQTKEHDTIILPVVASAGCDNTSVFADSRLGTFEVKGAGDRDGGSYTKAKAEELQKYIKQQKNKKLFGGIAIEKKDGWKINQKKKYDWSKYEKKDWSDWGDLIF